MYINLSFFYCSFMLYKKTEGIILKVIPYSDQTKIIKIFTKEFGIVSVWYKKKKMAFSLTPLIYGEFSLKKKESSSFFLLEDHTFFSAFEKIRQDLSLIKGFSHMVKGILFLEKEEPKLFSLFLFFLQKLETTQNPFALVSSFYLKVLHYEGLLHLSKTCSQCEKEASSLHKGESLCSRHSLGPSFAPSEFQALFTFLSAKKLSEIESLSFPEKAYSQLLISLLDTIH